MPRTDLMIDADGHVLEPARLWREYVEPRFRDRAIQVIEREDGTETLRVPSDRPPSVSRLGPVSAGWCGRDLRECYRRNHELKYERDAQQGGFLPEPRLRDMDTEEIRVAVLYPTMYLYLGGIQDVALADALCRAYNNWLADYCRADPKRLFGVAAVPLQDVELARREATRAVRDLGFRGVFIRPNPYLGRKKFHHPDYDPFWTTIQDLDVPLGLHPFLMDDMPGAIRDLGLKDPASPDPAREIYITQMVGNPFDEMLALSCFIMGGVCERFPRLRLLFLESGGGWIAHWLERMDHHREIFDSESRLKLKPSDYFRRQCWISFDPDEKTLPAIARFIGADRVLWASDYPHPDAIYPGAVRALRGVLAELPAADQARIFGSNAREVYKLPLN